MSGKTKDLLPLFTQAQSFYVAALFLVQKGNERGENGFVDLAKPNVAVPYSTLLAFSVELCLKCLVELEGITPGYTHELDALYKKLPKTLRDDIQNDYVFSSLFGRVSGALGNETVEELLRESSKMFAQSRYLHEGKGAQGSLNGILVVTLVRAILKKRPNWRTHVDAELKDAV